MSPRLPIPGADSDTWGEILNEFLSVSHDTDGTVKPEAVTTTSLQDSSVSGTKLQDTSITNAKLDAGTGTDGQVLTYNSYAPSGLSWAAAAILEDNSVSTAKLQDDSVSNSKLQANAVSSSKLQDSSISSAKIQDGAISSTKIQNASIGQSKIDAGIGADSKVLSFDSSAPSGLSWVSIALQDNSVSTTKLQDNSVSTSKIQDGSVSTAKLQDASVSNAKLQDNSISNTKLQDASVSSAKIQDGAISSAKMQNASITGAMLNAGTGADSQILTFNSTAPGGLSWVALTIPDNSVSTAKLQDASVVSSKIQDTAVTGSKLNAGAGTDGQYLTKDSTAAGGLSWKTPTTPTKTLTFSLTSFFKTGTLTTTTGTNRLPIDGTYTIVGTRLMVNTAPTGANIIVDIKKNGTTIYTTQANRPTILAGQNAGGPGATPDVTALAAGDYLTVDIVQVGSTVAGSDLNVSVVVSKTI